MEDNHQPELQKLFLRRAARAISSCDSGTGESDNEDDCCQCDWAQFETWLEARKKARDCRIDLGAIIRASSRSALSLACVGAMPSGGILVSSTHIRIDRGSPVPRLAKLQLKCIEEPQDLDSDVDAQLYNDYVQPFLLSRRPSDSLPGTPVPLSVVSTSGPAALLRITKDGVEEQPYYFCVTESEPSLSEQDERFGIVDAETLVYVEQERTPLLTKIHVLPYRDTLPTAYDYDLFGEYVGPYFESQPLKVFAKRDVFTYQGICFRVVRVDPPDAPGRVGPSTEVFCEGQALEPKLRDLLGFEMTRRLSIFPDVMQFFLAHSIWQAIPREALQPGRGLESSDLELCEVFQWSENCAGPSAPTSCNVCLAAFADGDELRRLGCFAGHFFHKSCIDEWLRRSPNCPVCKQPAAPQPQ